MQSGNIPVNKRGELSHWYRRHAERLNQSLDQFRRELADRCMLAGLCPTLKWRVKSFKSFYAKVLRMKQGQRSNSLERAVPTDLLGMRVVLPFLEDIRHSEQLIESEYEVIEREKRVGDRHDFGYESTHYLITLPAHIVKTHMLDDQQVCEIQLRTILQDAWAEVEHELVYKAEFNPFDEPLRRKLAALNANLTLSDIVFQEARAYQRQLLGQLKRRRRMFTTMMLGQDRPHSPGPAVPGGADTISAQDGDSPDQRKTAAALTGRSDEMPEGMIPDGDATIDNLLLYALRAHNRGDFERALSIYDQILQVEDRGNLHAIIYIHRGMAHVARGDYRSALADFSKAISLNPKNPKGYFHRALVHQFENRFEDALGDLRDCLILDPAHSDALLSRSRLHFDQSHYEAAMRDCDEALALEPDLQQAHEWRAQIIRAMRL